MAFITVLLVGCHSAPSDANVKKLSTAYADFLIARRMTPGDSIATVKRTDSVLKRYDYENEQDLVNRIKAVGNDPDKLRQLFDSAQRRLESVQNGKLQWKP